MTVFEPDATDAAVLDALLKQLQDAAVRDLAWLLLSAPLLRERSFSGRLASAFETSGEARACAAWLIALDEDPQALHHAIAAARLTRLGRYAECLLAWYLQHGPAPTLVAANVALRRAGRTLGECDFLVETASGARLHWELAVKCYLYVGGGGDARLTGYVGPNLRDRFDLKLAHLLKHQLPLSARDEFASLGHAGPWHAQMFVKGWLFYHLDDAKVAPVFPMLPPAVAEHHSHGFWVTRSEWSGLAAADAWMILPRLCWLAPRPAMTAGNEQTAGLLAREALAARFATSAGPTMVAAFARDVADGCWRERLRGFVVPDDWPGQAAVFSLGAHHQR